MMLAGNKHTGLVISSALFFLIHRCYLKFFVFCCFLKVADGLSREPKISAVYASDLKRASETAEIIAKKCGVTEV